MKLIFNSSSSPNHPRSCQLVAAIDVWKSSSKIISDVQVLEWFIAASRPNPAGTVEDAILRWAHCHWVLPIYSTKTISVRPKGKWLFTMLTSGHIVPRISQPHWSDHLRWNQFNNRQKTSSWDLSHKSTYIRELYPNKTPSINWDPCKESLYLAIRRRHR